MYVKKAGGKVFGAEFTAAEKKAMRIEIMKEQAEFNRANENEIDAIILWWLRTKLGFGEKRLTDFYRDFIPAYRGLIARYEMGDDQAWLFTHLLKEDGIDIQEIRKKIFGTA